MKVLSLTQPWASLVILGAKKLETRSWNTSYRGELGIHASAGFPEDAREWVDGEWEVCEHFRKALGITLDQIKAAGGVQKILPLGKILGAVELVTTHHTEAIRDGLEHDERLFGCYDDFRFAFELRNPQKFDDPMPAKGMLGLWDWHMPADLNATAHDHEIIGSLSLSAKLPGF